MLIRKTASLFFAYVLLACLPLQAQVTVADNTATLHQLQQQFVDLRFGMFIHFNIPTYANQDWPDPETPASVFNPQQLDCNQWAKAAKSAHMSYGCLTTKHHSGFCIWNTRSTDYNVMNSPFKKDVVKEYVEAFRANGLKVMLYYSILDTHHKLRPNSITAQHRAMVKTQLTELLTNYGKIEALIIDGWDAPWSRISYDDISFEEVYLLVKKLQPQCLLMDLNGAKYPAEGMFYTDIKTYEMGAGQRVSDPANRMPSLACLPVNDAWFWKTDFPTKPVKQAATLVNNQLLPLNKASCNFILNVAPNRDGLIDSNALATLQEIGSLWNNEGPMPALPFTGDPVISSNLAKHKPSNSSWSWDMNIMDFANDDDFTTAWESNREVKEPWYEVTLGKDQRFNTLVITEPKANVTAYRVEYYQGGEWKPLLTGSIASRVKMHRFATVKGEKIRVWLTTYHDFPAIAELGVYNSYLHPR